MSLRRELIWRIDKVEYPKSKNDNQTEYRDREKCIAVLNIVDNMMDVFYYKNN